MEEIINAGIFLGQCNTHIYIHTQLYACSQSSLVQLHASMRKKGRSFENFQQELILQGFTKIFYKNMGEKFNFPFIIFSSILPFGSSLVFSIIIRMKT